MERPGSVGAQLHPGADLLEFWRLLVDVDLEALLHQGECCRQPIDPAAGNQQ
jgi:hypothetical protein